MRPIFVVLCLIVMCLSAQLSFDIPITETGIPFTAQSLALFIIAGLLRPMEFLVVIVSYLVLGIIGVPVYADGSSGLDKILGASGGFLYGFIFSGLFISYNIQSNSSPRITKLVTIMIIGTIVLFAFGIFHLAVKFGLEKGLEYGFYPFWQMGLFKAILAATIVYLAMKQFKLLRD